MHDLLIMEFINDACELNEYCVKHFCRSLSFQEVLRKRRFIDACARAVRHLHACGIYHADLKSNNLLVQENGERGWDLYFIDLDRVAFKRELSFRERAKNLAQMNASVTACIDVKDRLRFFKTYAQGTSVIHHKRRYYKKILTISRTKVTHPYGIDFTPPVKPTS